MPRTFLPENARDALSEAVRAVEAESSVEVVVAIRHRSAPYRGAAFLLGTVTAMAALGFMLFSPVPFSLLAIAVDPWIAGGLVGLLIARLPPVVRLLTPGAMQRAAVLRAAHATFLEKGVHRTRDRTGILVYVSLLERRAELVRDLGVEGGVSAGDWERCEAAIQEAVASGGNGAVLAEAVRGLAATCGPTLPRLEDDVNELPDEICAP